MWTDLPAPVTEALERLNAQGYQGFLVGGCVRDLLRGVPPTDYDMTTSATPEEVKKLFSDKNVVETGVRHGTVTVFSRGMPLEITTFRTDGSYSDGRHPDGVTFASTIEEDLARRDFTVNAMAWNPRKGLADPFGGREDLQKRLIRCVGEPSRRFDEDALRILRGVRFASVLGFAIEENTSRAIHAQTPLLAKVSIERISAELAKLLCGAGAAEVLTAFRDLLAFLLPELPEVSLDTRLQALASVPREPALRLAVLLADLPPHEAGKLLRRLRMENKLSLQVTALIREQRTLLTCTDTPCLLRLFRKFPPELAEALLTLTEALHGTSMAQMRGRVESLLASSPCLSVAQLAVGGKELMELGIPAGEKMGEALQMLLEGVTDGKWENSREALLSAAKSWHSVC